MVREYVRTKKHQETKHPFPSHMETEFRFQNTETILSKTPKLSVSETPKLSVSKTPKLSVSKRPKQNSVSTPLETKFCFHSTQNKILFPLHSKQNSVSRLHYSINPNRFVCPRDGQPHHGSKAAQYHRRTTYDQVHGLVDRTNGANGCPRQNNSMGQTPWLLALVLDNVDYATVTRKAVTLTNRLVQPPAVNPAIKDDTP